MIKFEGEVNGEKFTNVDDYNEALKKAIEEGVSINASSKTYACGGDEPCKVRDEHESELINGCSNDDYALGVIYPMNDDLDLDTFCGGERDNTYLDSIKEAYDLDKLEEVVKETLDNHPDEVLNILRRAYQKQSETDSKLEYSEGAAKELECRQHKVAYKMKEYERRLEELEHEYDESINKCLILDNSIEALNIVYDYYQNLISGLEKTEPCKKLKDECKTTCKCKSEQKVFDIDETLNGVKKLLGEIFGV